MLTSITSSPALFRALFVAIAVSCFAIQARAAGVDLPPAVKSYAAAMDDLRTSGGKQPIEPVFEAGMQASPQVQAVLPDLSEAQYQEVQRQMQGSSWCGKSRLIFGRPERSESYLARYFTGEEAGGRSRR